MNRREFSKQLALISAGAQIGWAEPGLQTPAVQTPEFYQEPAKNLPARRFDVVVAGAGTAGVVAALAAARQGARTILIEQKGYPGGTVTEGGTSTIRCSSTAFTTAPRGSRSRMEAHTASLTGRCAWRA